jgi:hypothetical protein
VTNLANLNNGLPCSGSTAQVGGNSLINLTLTPNGSDIGVATLARTSAPSCSTSPCPNQSVAYRFLAATTLNGTTLCPGAVGDGCVHGDATRNIGRITLGDLPAGISRPNNWNGYYVLLGNFSDSVSAEAGVGSSAPTGTAPTAGTGQISYWNWNSVTGTGSYVTCTVYAANCPPVGGNFTIPAFTWTTQVDGKNFVVTETASLKTGGAPVPTSTCSGTCTRTSASAVSGAPLLGDISYVVTYNGVTMASLTIHVDLGTLRASASYQAAPSGG